MVGQVIIFSIMLKSGRSKRTTFGNQRHVKQVIEYSLHLFLIDVMFAHLLVILSFYNVFGWNDYIVKLNEYYFQVDIHDILFNATECSSNLQFRWRQNFGARYPTDFGIIRIDSDAQSINEIIFCYQQNEFTNKLISGVYIDSISNLRIKSSVVDRISEESDIEKIELNSDGLIEKEEVFEYVSIASSPTATRQFSMESTSRRILLDNLRGSVNNSNSNNQRKLPKNIFVPGSITSKVHPTQRGQNVKIAIFDTGMHIDHPRFDHVKERIDWTQGDSDNIEDGVGHGTFVSSIIGGNDQECPGIASQSDLYIFKLFTSKQASYTSWFLDAFNYALFRGIDVLNLSIGGPDHNDRPFIDKIHELSANGIIVVSAIGNDGIWGSANNPADMMDVIGVGGYDNLQDLKPRGNGTQPEIAKRKRAGLKNAEPGKTAVWEVSPAHINDHHKWGDVSPFSSRGMTTWDIQLGLGLLKPDLVAPSMSLYGSSNTAPFECKTLSGTSVASPVVAAVVALLLSTTSNGFSSIRPLLAKKDMRNVAAVKQILHASSEMVGQSSMYAVGSGLLNVDRAIDTTVSFTPHASLYPDYISNFPELCPYYTPYCNQKFFYGSAPLIYNLTVLNSVSVRSAIVGFQWEEVAHARKTKVMNEYDSGVINTNFTMLMEENEGSPIGIIHVYGGILRLKIQYCKILYPWTGFVAVGYTINEDAKDFVGYIKGILRVRIRPLQPSTMDTDDDNAVEEAVFETEIAIMPPVPRQKRILWDVYHGINYPSAYIPKDDIRDDRYMLDWFGDHPYTNYLPLYQQISKAGYSVELLRSPWTCFDASEYGILLVLDPEDEFSTVEVEKLERDVWDTSLSVIIIGDWHDATQLINLKFPDDSTHSIWYPIVGGSNIPAINKFLKRFNASFGLHSFEGDFYIGEEQVKFRSGNTIAEWPAGGDLLSTSAFKINPTTKKHLRSDMSSTQSVGAGMTVKTGDGVNKGRIIAYGDSNCWDSSSQHMLKENKKNEISSWNGCLLLFKSFLKYVQTGAFAPQIEKNVMSSGSENKWPHFTHLVENFNDSTLITPHTVSMTTADVEELDIDLKAREVEFKRYSKTHLNDGCTEKDCMCNSIF